MSDRYRPPSGPKGARAPSLEKQNWKNPNHKPPNQSGLAANKFKQREHYNPSYNHGPRAHSRNDQNNSSTSHLEHTFQDSSSRERQNSSGGYRDNQRNRKRAQNDSTSSKNVSYSNKRRDFTSKNHSQYSQPSLNQVPPRPQSSSNSRNDQTRPTGPSNNSYSAPSKPSNPIKSPPKGPRLSKEPQRGKPAVSQPLSNQPKKSNPSKKIQPPKLRVDQIYSFYTVRTTDLYKRVQQVGEGTYGKVYKACNEVTGEYVAIKRLRLETEREGFPITAMREIKLLQSFEHPNIVGLLEMMVEHNLITMVFDYLDHDLTGLLTHPDMQLSDGHRKTIFRQLLDGINYLHKKRVIHRDIKGSNILLNSSGVLKIADFGLARKMKVLREGESPDYTNRVITIWYRPPELLMGSTNYGREVDIWGVGCLLLELYTKVATFQGTEEISQLYKIYEIMGTPSLEYWPEVENLPWFEMLKPQVNRSSLFEREFAHQMTPDSFDLAKRMLELHPAKRISAEEALDHPYFTNEPRPEPLTFMQLLEGEWHEFETKKRRREERRKLQESKNNKGIEPVSLSTEAKVIAHNITPTVTQNSSLKALSEVEFEGNLDHTQSENAQMLLRSA